MPLSLFLIQLCLAHSKVEVKYCNIQVSVKNYGHTLKGLSYS